MSKINQTLGLLKSAAKGIMALDESPRSMGRRFQVLGIPVTEESRLAFFAAILGGSDLGKRLSGVILYDDLLGDEDRRRHIRQCAIEQGLVLGVRADKGVVPLPGHPGQSYTIGLDDLPDRLLLAAKAGCGFVKWRAAFRVADDDRQALQANALSLALYVLAALEHHLVPIVEVEVELDGAHTSAQCADVTRTALSEVFRALADFAVDPSQVILKTNFVLPGNESGAEIRIERAVSETASVLAAAVPPDVSLLAFLSGGLPSDTSIGLLAEMHRRQTSWRTTFSFGRALWMEPLRIWSGQAGNVERARQRLAELTEQAAAAV